MLKFGRIKETVADRLSVFSDLKFLTFVLPFVTVLLVFALCGVYPAGTKTMLTVDLYHQYMPFIYELKAKLLGGRSLFYSWNSGLGNEFYAVFANYCASPLNLLALLFPYKALPVYVAFITAVRAGLAALFMGVFLSRIDLRKYDLVTMSFGVSYALCGWFLSDFWNIMWCDAYVLLPVICLGLLKLMAEGKYTLYVTMLAQTDRRGLINGTSGYIEIENINNYEMVRVFNLERKIVAEYTAPTQITGYEYEVISAMKAISNGMTECPEMPHAQILRMMQLMDSIRGAWGIEFPFEKDNTIRITAQDIDPNKRSSRVRTADDKEEGRQGSVVRKISETSDKQAGDAGRQGAASSAQADMADGATAGHTKQEAGKEQEKAKHKAGKEEQARKILKIKKTVKGKAEAMPSAREVRREKPKSTTQKLRELGEELRVENSGSAAGSVTDRIQGLVIDEEKPVDNRSLTGKLKDLSIDDEKERSIKEFQRRRSEPGISGAALELAPGEEEYYTEDEEADEELISSLVVLAEREERKRRSDEGTESLNPVDYDDTVLFDDDYEELE